MSLFNKVTKSFQWGDKTVVMETGEIARQANGAVLVDIDGTVILATVAAIVSGLAPGTRAETEMVGKSTCGNGATGNKRNATAPSNKIAKVSSVVATGRLIKGWEMLTMPLPPYRAFYLC